MLRSVLIWLSAGLAILAVAIFISPWLGLLPPDTPLNQLRSLILIGLSACLAGLALITRFSVKQSLRLVLISLSAGLAGVAMFAEPELLSYRPPLHGPNEAGTTVPLGPSWTSQPSPTSRPPGSTTDAADKMEAAKQAGEQELEATLYVIQNLVPPEVVQLENVQVEGDMKTIYVGNANKHYLLFCNIKADGCITPEENKNYLLFDSNTRWEMPGAKDFLTLKFMQDWTVTYNQGKNIGLIAEDPSTPSTGLGIGMFILDETGGGYEQDTVSSDGPIIYGTGMNDQDRRARYQKVQ